MSDRRSEGGGSAWLVKFSPPPGKLIKIVATARSDEHVFNPEGGRGTKTGQPARSSGGYSLNPEGQPHSAFIGQETIAFVVYSGELDEVHSMEVVDIQPAGGTDPDRTNPVAPFKKDNPCAEAVVSARLTYAMDSAAYTG